MRESETGTDRATELFEEERSCQTEKITLNCQLSAALWGGVKGCVEVLPFEFHNAHFEDLIRTEF